MADELNSEALKAAENSSFFYVKQRRLDSIEGSMSWRTGLAEAIAAYLAALPKQELSGWRPIESAPRDGTPILIDFGRVGVHMVSWTKPANCNWEIWCVDDRKFGPYPLRGYIETDLKAWQPMPYHVQK